MVSVLLSASVARCFVSRMQDFFVIGCTIRTRQEIQCLPYARFFFGVYTEGLAYSYKRTLHHVSAFAYVSVSVSVSVYVYVYRGFVSQEGD